MNSFFKKKQIAFFLPMFFVLLLVFSACAPTDDNNQPVKPTSVEITSPASNSIVVGSHDLKAIVMPQEASQEITFSLEQGAEGVSLNDYTLIVDSQAPHQAQIKVKATSVEDESVFIVLYIYSIGET